ncbi:MAG: hypothetical protein WBO89_03590, partial [Propionicimonas sp.]
MAERIVDVAGEQFFIRDRSLLEGWLAWLEQLMFTRARDRAGPGSPTPSSAPVACACGELIED